MGPESRRPGESADALRVTRIPAFTDNYFWLVHGMGPRADRVAVVDPGDAAPVLQALADGGLVLEAILATHHHPDHVGGIEGLLRHARVPVYGPAGEDIPGRTVAVREGSEVVLDRLGLAFEVLEVPGHTAGHIAYVGHGALFCGDTLFSGGCGRLFEGTARDMLGSLDKLGRLPGATRVYCAHEYTQANLRFAVAVEPGNADLLAYAAEVAARRARNAPTIPSTLGLESRINPFLRTREGAVRAAANARAGHPLSDDAEAFGVIRSWKDGFRA